MFICTWKTNCFHRSTGAQFHNAYQNKVTSQNAKSHVQSVSGILLIHLFCLAANFLAVCSVQAAPCYWPQVLYFNDFLKLCTKIHVCASRRLCGSISWVFFNRRSHSQYPLFKNWPTLPSQTIILNIDWLFQNIVYCTLKNKVMTQMKQIFEINALPAQDFSMAFPGFQHATFYLLILIFFF